jgi:hypothetical protein
MTAATRFAQAWAESALSEIRALGDEELNLWIVTNRVKIADCARNAPDAVKRVRLALADRDREIRAEQIRQGVG